MEFMDKAFVLYGSFLAVLSFVLYVLLGIWPQIKEYEPSIRAVPSLMLSFGMSLVINGIIVGFGRGMSDEVLILLTVLMMVFIIWCLISVYKFSRTMKTMR